MQEIYTIMSATLGVPPSPDVEFNWDYYDKDGKVGNWKGTPKEYYKAFVNKAYSVSGSDPRTRTGADIKYLAV